MCNFRWCCHLWSKISWAKCAGSFAVMESQDTPLCSCWWPILDDAKRYIFEECSHAVHVGCFERMCAALDLSPADEVMRPLACTVTRVIRCAWWCQERMVCLWGKSCLHHRVQARKWQNRSQPNPMRSCHPNPKICRVVSQIRSLRPSRGS